MNTARAHSTSTRALSVEGLRKVFPLTTSALRRDRRHIVAVDGVDFGIREGEIVALVGESGSGKSTIGRMLVGLTSPTAGKIRLSGREVAATRREDLTFIRKQVQMVFQDPYASLNPRMTVGDTLKEAVTVASTSSRQSVGQRVRELLSQVGLPDRYAARYPHEFSGGQRQRIGIARALAVNPWLLVADEPVSALDVSIQAQVINLLQDLQLERGLAILFVAHDLAVVEHIADRVIVLYRGRIMETGTKRAVFGGASHPYTRTLLDAVPRPDPRAAQRRPAMAPVLGSESRSGIRVRFCEPLFRGIR